MVENRVCPILPVTDLARSLAHYAALGCTVSRHDDTYGFAEFGEVELHLSVVEDHDPLRTASAMFLHVRDADELARRWADVPRTGAPVDTDYGIREGWHIDPDGNLIRFGSPLQEAGRASNRPIPPDGQRSV